MFVSINFLMCNIMSSIGLAYQGKDIVFRLMIEYHSFRDFGPKVIGLFLYEDF
jgi:hypothetical protein